MKFQWKYPIWATEHYQKKFEKQATKELVNKADGRYRVYMPYYCYACGTGVFNAPHQRYVATGASGTREWIPHVLILRDIELTIGCHAAKVGEVVVSHRHLCPRCAHCVLDHAKITYNGNNQVAEWAICTCGCEFYTEEVFAPYDHRQESREERSRVHPLLDHNEK